MATAYTKFQPVTVAIYEGDTKNIKFTVKDSAGSAVDLSAYTITAQGRTHRGAWSELFEITIEDAVGENDHANGVVELTIPPATTASLPARSVFDIQAVFGEITNTILTGRLIKTIDITA